MSFGTMLPRNLVRASQAPRRDADRLFDELWNGVGRVPTALAGPRATSFVPHLDVVENEDEYRVTAELPGLEEEDFEVVLEDGVLTLKGEKKGHEEEEGTNYCRVESRVGEFTRRLKFSQPIDADNIKAKYKNGVLTVTIPKPEEAKPQVRTITVETR